MLRRIACLLVIVPVLASSQSVKVETFKLPNGMAVILNEDHSLPIVTTNIWYGVGSKDEPDRRSGFAHLFEHLMFMGTKRVPNGVFDSTMEEYGGANNASTANDRTNYYNWGPSSLLPVLLWLEADRLESLADDMTLEKLNLQREVVKNERRQGVENAPYGRAYDSIDGLMFPKGHPYHTTVIGSMEDLNAASLQDVQDFFRTFYVPNNASMVVAGDFDPKAAKSLIQKLFGSLKRGSDIVRKSFAPAKLTSAKRVTMVDDVSTPKLVMVWHSPKAYSDGDVAMNVASGVLAEGAGSRLFKDLVIEKGLATEISATQESRLLGSLFYVDATPREGVSLDRLQKGIDQVLARFAKEGPSKVEVDRQVAKFRFSQLNAMQSLMFRADKMNEYQFYFGAPDGFAKDLARYSALTPAAIKSSASAALRLDARLILRVVPQITQPERNPRDERPEMSPPKSFAFPAPITLRLPNGQTLYYWQKKGLPITAVTLRLAGGASLDSPEKSGLTGLTADMLQEGAGGRDSEAFANALDALGASFRTGADQMGISISLSAGTDKLAKALPLMADAVLRPSLKADDWERVKAAHLQGLEQDDDDPGTVASKVAAREFFGADHPYSRPVGGLAATVSRLNLKDAQAEYASRIRSAHGTWFAAGDLSADAFRKLLAASFNSWKPSSAAGSRHDFGKLEARSSRLLIVDRPNAVQTAISILLPSVAFASPERPAIQELGIVLGGTFTSRLNRNLREDKGFTYGIGYRSVFGKQTSYATLRTSVRTDVTGASLKEILSEISSIRGANVTEAEANKARSQYQYDATTDAESLQGLVGAGVSYFENGIPLNQVAAELARFADVKTADLNAAARKAVPWESAVIVLVGDQKEILKQIEGLGLPKPEIVKP